MTEAPPFSTSSGPDVDLGFRTCTYGYTIVANVEASAWISAGLILIGLAEMGLFAPLGVVLLRYSAWLLFEFSHKVIGIGDLRSLAVIGLEGGPQRIAVCPGHSLFPFTLRANALERGLSTCGPFFNALALTSILAAVFAILVITCIGDEHEHLGIVPIYLIGNALSIPLMEKASARALTSLNQEYATATGASCLGFAIVGIFSITSGFAFLQRLTGMWTGFMIPPVLSSYEILGSRAVSSVVATQLAEREDVRQSYAGTRQGLYPSCIIGLLQALAECARLTLLLCDAGSGESGGDMWMVAIPTTFVWNVFIRMGCVHYLVSRLRSDMKLRMAATDRLRLDMMYTMGYTRYFGVLSIVLARCCLGNAVVPPGQERLAVVFLVQLLEEVLEDVVVSVLSCCGMTAASMSGGLTEYTDDAIRIMAEKRLVVKKNVKKAKARNKDMNAVIPIEGTQEVKDLEELEAEIKLVRARLAFLFSSPSFGIQPYWSHFSICIVAQLHMVLLLIIFANGVPFVLGFCTEQGYDGMERGLMFWPVPDEDTICSPS
mmetsp:Transcript_109810/g.266982  ORF Transcript_109810/g.266982 Transcript_109810/m.266982 type:complete len:546 (+) Transcript_109810:73-1710(+)